MSTDYDWKNLKLMDLKLIGTEIELTNADRLRWLAFALWTWWMKIDYFKIGQFYWDQEDEAIEEIAQALKERNARNARDRGNDPKPWSEQKFYEEARMTFEVAKKYAGVINPEEMRKWLRDDLAFFQRKGWMRIEVRNESPKKRRGRKRKLQFSVIQGGYREDTVETGYWRAKDLLSVEL